MPGTQTNIKAVFKLANLAAQIRKVGKVDFNQLLLVNFTKLANAQINREFSTKTDADGMPWAPLKRDKTRGTLMITTGTLKKAFKFEAARAGIRVVNRTPYAMYHQSDAPRSRLPQRTMIPNPGKPIGMPWADVFNKAMKKTMTQWVKATTRKKGER